MQLLQSFNLKKVILLCFLSCCTLLGYSQLYNKIEKINTDSLIKLLPELNKKEKIQIYFKLAEYNYLKFPEVALDYADTAMKLSQETNNNELIALASYYHGKAYYFLGQYDKAISVYLPAFQYAKDSKNIKLMILLDEALVFAYFYSGNNDVTKKHLEEIETHLQYLPDTAYLAHFTIGLGYFYRYLEFYEKAIFYFLEYQALYSAHPMSPAVLALSYTHLGYCYEQTGEFDKALLCFQKDIEISDSLNLNTRSYLYLGGLYLKMDSITEAIKYYKNAVKYYDEKGNIYYKALSSLALGKTYMALDEFQESNQALKQALSSAEWMYGHKMIFSSLSYEINSFYSALQIVEKYKEEEALKLISNIHYQLYQLYFKQKQFEKALQEYSEFHKAYEMSNASERITAIEEIKDKYEAEQKDQQIELISQQNVLNEIRVKQSLYLLFGLAGLIILIVTLAILLIRQNKLKASQNTILLEQKLLRSQMNPHFIFNALSNISNLIDKNDNTTASKYLNRFSKLVRHILESTRSDYIELDQEVANLENYLALQKLRFNDKFDFQIQIDSKIDSETIEIPPMLIQPFIENAIEHGIKPKEINGHIDIRFKMKGKLIVCEIDDDGIGRKKATEMKVKSHQSLATSITEERLRNLSRKLKHKISLEIIDLKTEANVSLGTRVILGLPYRET
jgi:tetratricopeptide (TPR) repeat protein